MNSIYNNCSSYIDCNTTKTIRNKIINKYKLGELPFLVNVRILVEGFDAPITKGVCFMSLPSSNTTLIQIIGRALRLHQDKAFANIILPFSKKDDEEAISNFMKIMAKNDSRICKSYNKKKLGGYFTIEDTVEDDECDMDEDLMNDIELKNELIFDSMGKLKNRTEIWLKKLEEVKNYIDINGKTPSCMSKNKDIKKMGVWTSKQKQNYIIRKKIMKDDIIYNKFKEFLENYKEYLLLKKEKWNGTFSKVIKYIDENKKLPSRTTKNKEIKKLGTWISTQKQNYIKRKENMKDDIIYNKFTIFLENYKKYF
jgi:hypothetical protein